MRKILQTLICLPVLIIGPQVLGQTAPGHQSDYYKAGLVHRDAGDWMEAVKSWVSAGQILQRQQKTDPRIGISFIELITEKKAVKYYELACEMYLWGFSPGGVQQYNKDIENEVERIVPLLNKSMRKKWHSLLKKNDPQLFTEIKSFWINKDPTPTTPTNERLLEHWQRIVHARKNFRNGKNTAYGTDDRGLIYVKYGAPERIVKGSLGTKRADFKQWTDIMIEGNETISGQAAGLTSQPGQRAEEQGFLFGEIDRFNNYPEYEIWFYYSFDADEPISYMFGNREGIGRYGLRDGVEDFIPGRAFLRTSSYRTGGVSPGAILQSVYYSELMHLRPDFEDRYNDLQQIWDSLGSSNSASVANNLFRLKRQGFKTADKFNPASAFVPSEKSNVDQTIPKVKMLVSPFRFLNKQDIPNIALVALSYPQIGMDTIMSSQGGFPDYSVTHTAITYDGNQNEIRRQSELLQSGEDNIYTIILPHKDIQNNFMIITEVFHFPTISGVDTGGKLDMSPKVIALGRANIPGLPPLLASKESLEISDLLIGVKNPGETELQRLPFPLVPSSRILAADILKIYFEIYHLYFDKTGAVHYSIDFEVAQLQGKKKEKEESISLSFNFDAYESTSKEEFEIDISKLTSGSYELVVQVTDKISGQKKFRAGNFEIME